MFKCSFELTVKKNGTGKSRITSQQSSLFCLGFCIAPVMDLGFFPGLGFLSYFHLNSNVNEQPHQTKWLQDEFQLVENSHSQAGGCFPIAKITYRAVHKSWTRGDRSCGSSSDNADKQALSLNCCYLEQSVSIRI